MRRLILSAGGLCALIGSFASGQTPAPMPVATNGVMIPQAPQDKKADDKGKAAEPKQVTPKASDPVPPPVTFPTINNAAFPSSALAAAGASARRTTQPNVFGDLFGGFGVRGTMAVPVDVLGRPIGFRPTFILADGRRVVLGSTNQPPVDESVFAQNPVAPAGTPVAGIVAVRPPEGAVFAPEQAGLVSRQPIAGYGAFKVAENESPRPTTRAYFTYNYYDDLFSASAPYTPRVGMHQEIFGLEYANESQTFSIGARIPYYQLVSPGFYNETGLGALTIILKGVIAENEETGSLLSAGMVVTAPTGRRPERSTVTGERVYATLLQPYLGYIVNRSDWYAQGFTSIVVPTDSSDVTFLANDLQVGYLLYKNPGAFLSGFTPVAEAHLNTPLNHRGNRSEPVGFSDHLTVLGGFQLTFFDNASLGFVVGAPVTGPRPYSLQATCQFNLRF